MSDITTIIKGAQSLIKGQYGYIFHEDTVEILDSEHCTWIAQVTTTHNAQRGEPECTFFPLGVYVDFVLFEKTALPALLDWCLKMAAKKGDANEQPSNHIRAATCAAISATATPCSRYSLSRVASRLYE